jgi:hypothetical protein
MSMLHVLAKGLANLEISMARASTFTAPTPSIIDVVNTSSPLAPSTMACSQLAYYDRRCCARPDKNGLVLDSTSTTATTLPSTSNPTRG